MKRVFPIILTKGSDFGYVSYVPDLDINSQGKTLEEAIEMTRDAIGLWGICTMNSEKQIPYAKTLKLEHLDTDIVTLVDIDFLDYKRKEDNKSVKKNVTLPSWLNYLAEKEHINFSQLLQKALKQELNVD